MRIVLLAVLLAVPQLSFAVQPVTSHVDRWEVDWGNQKLRLYGETKVGAESEGMEKASQRAWRDGVSYLNQNLTPALQQLQGEQAQTKAGLAGKLTSYNTIYYADGKVRVFLEAKLPEVFSVKTGAAFDASAAAGARHSSLVLQLDKGRSPSATYVVKDEAGKVLFDKTQVAQRHFDSNLMGRWYRGSPTTLPSNIVGSRPKIVTVKVTSGGDLQVSRSVWQEIVQADQGLLQQAKVVLLQP